MFLRQIWAYSFLENLIHLSKHWQQVFGNIGIENCSFVYEEANALAQHTDINLARKVRWEDGGNKSSRRSLADIWEVVTSNETEWNK